MYFLGVDLGTQVDNTAIALVKRNEVGVAEKNAWGKMEMRRVDATYTLLMLELVELGVSYTHIVERIYRIISDRRIKDNVTTIVDATGVGLPVIHMMRQYRIAPLVPISIHGGSAVNEKDHGYSVPKRDLVSSLMIVVQGRRMEIPSDIDNRPQLIRQMQSFTMFNRSNGGETWEALQEKDHDDIVLALSYAVWYPEKILGYKASNTSPIQAEKYDLLS